MKHCCLLLVLLPWLNHASAQDYAQLGDSCFALKDYTCAGINYDLFLEKVEGRSNNIAFKSARAWGLAGDTEKTIQGIRLWIANNYENNSPLFGDRLLKEPAFELVRSDKRWKPMADSVIAGEKLEREREQQTLNAVLAFQKTLFANPLSGQSFLTEKDPKKLYNSIRGPHSFQAIDRKLVSLQVELTDSQHTAFLIVLPDDYNPARPYTVLLFLHGAVSVNTGYLNMLRDWDTTGWNRFYSKYARLNDVIMVYPHGNRDFNWMSPEAGFFIVPKVLRMVKDVINVDDDRVFISGHSNGATGSFTYAVRQPSPFAGFYGFNTRPKVATGATYLGNLRNRSFMNVSVDQDYYYPAGAHDSLDALMKQMGIDYHDLRYNGFTHAFPGNDASEEPTRLLFEDMKKRKRNPFRASIEWECDDTVYGRCDWLQITKLDTLRTNTATVEHPNFRINKWIVFDENRELVTRDTSVMAFAYHRRSAKVSATYSNNTFRLATNGASSIRIYLSPEMVNFQKPVSVFVNSKKVVNKLVVFDRQFMLDEFRRTSDRKAVWVGYLDVAVD